MNPLYGETTEQWEERFFRDLCFQYMESKVQRGQRQGQGRGHSAASVVCTTTTATAAAATRTEPQPQEQQQQEEEEGLSNTLKQKETLALWIRQQRKQYWKRQLPEARVQILERIGFTWSREDDDNDDDNSDNDDDDDLNANATAGLTLAATSTTHDEHNKHSEAYFYKRLVELVEYRSVHGHCLVPAVPNKDKEDDASPPTKTKTSNRNNDDNDNDSKDKIHFPLLYPWIRSMRKAYRHKDNKVLDKRKIQILDSLGFAWHDMRRHRHLKPTAMQAWNDMYQQLCEYKRIHGHCNVPKVTSLSSTTTTTSTTTPSVTNQFQQLPQERELGKWVDRQRIWKRQTDHYNAKKQQQKQQAAAVVCATSKNKDKDKDNDSGNGNGSGNSDQNGDNAANITATTTTAKTATTNTTRTPGYARPVLLPEQIAKLDKIGFCWNLAPKVGWEARFQQLCEYRLEHGNTHVPQLYPKDRSFGRWVMKQRVQYHLLQQGKKSQMTKERIERLEKLGFAWVAPSYGAGGGTRKRQRPNHNSDTRWDEEQQRQGDNGASSVEEYVSE